MGNTPTVEPSGYVYVSTPMSFGAAQAYCFNTYGSNLATIIDADDRGEANVDIGNTDVTWIGLYTNLDEGWWIFRNGDDCPDISSGACVDFWGTANGAPNCIPDGTGYECAYYVADDAANDQGLVYNDLDCMEERPFLCQTNNGPPHLVQDNLEFIGGNGDITTSDCVDNVITITCTEPDLSFDADTETIRSVIDLDFPDGITVENVIVATEFEHTWVGDLQAFLTKNATWVRLFGDTAANGCCGCGADDVNVVLSDAATIGSSDGTVCDYIDGYGIGGTRQPVDALSAFDGMEANGEWIMYVYDYIGNDKGTFGTWSLTLTLSECPPDEQPVSFGLSDMVNIANDGNKGENVEHPKDGGGFHFDSIFYEIVASNIISSVFTISMILSILYCCYVRKMGGNEKINYDPVDKEDQVVINKDDV